MAAAEPVETAAEEAPLTSTVASRRFDIRFRDKTWSINVELTDDPAQSQWLVVSGTAETCQDPRRLDIRLSMVHPFMIRFAQMETDDVEALLRVAAALALAEVLARDSGVRKAGTVRRNVDDILKDALAETLDFLRTVVPEESRDSIRDSAISILAKVVPPTAWTGQETGLVIGYVQSGKTMSFETVAALARDNAFQIVIIVAGTATPLLEQSTGRLRRDLRLDQPDRARRWIQFQNPRNNDATVQAIRDVLDDWRDPTTPDGYKKTVLIHVLSRINDTYLTNRNERVQIDSPEGTITQRSKELFQKATAVWPAPLTQPVPTNG